MKGLLCTELLCVPCWVSAWVVVFQGYGSGRVVWMDGWMGMSHYTAALSDRISYQRLDTL